MRGLRNIRQSFTADLQVLVETNKPTYFAGESVEGTVILKISQPVKSLKTLTVTITGAEWATTKWADHLYSEHHDFFSCDIPIVSLAGEAFEPGDHLSWSFATILPADLPSTMKAGHECFWKIEYGVKAKVERSAGERGNMSRPRSSDESVEAIKVLQSCQRGSLQATAPSWNACTTTYVRRCFCHRQGSISLGFRVDRTVLRRGETFQVAVAILNKSFISMVSTTLKIQLVQQAKWMAENVSALQREVIQGEVLQSSAACCVNREQLGSAGERTQYASLDEATDAASRILSPALENGECEAFSLVVPWEVASETGDASVLSPYFNLISSLQHFVRVRLETELFATNVELLCPVTVIDGTSKVVITKH